MKYIKSMHVERVRKCVDNCLTKGAKIGTMRSASLVDLSLKMTNFLKIRYV
ncbi:MAG: hypothetical protein ACD_5C00206G0002 [uncultured bacterium]|nr:MAG: hypothetical protein ACD_5C00206G0002 [uncultured bacterium]